MYIKKGEEFVRVRKLVWIPMLFLIIILAVVLTVMAVNPFGPTKFNEFGKFSRGIELLEDNFYEDIDGEKLLDGALWGISASVEDPYTVYMTSEEAQSFLENIDSEDYAGVGLYISIDEEDNSVIVTQPIEGSPAAEAGIVAGDKIIAVDGEATNGISLDLVAANMKGAEGTEVVLTLLKAETGETVDVKLVRAIVERRTVTSKLITETTGCITISQFGANTRNEFIEEYNALAGKEVENLVIDLRNNPGGYLDQAVGIADVFLSEGTIVYTLNKAGEKVEYTADKNKTKAPMVILVNGGSASASEVLVGAMKDYGMATIVGEKTYGKGVTQITCEFSDGSLMKITDSRYYTPNGVCIDHEGITPDVEVVLDEEKYTKLSELTLEEDDQLKKAIEILEQK